MAVGLPRSVLTGTARHGSRIIRNAILQRRAAAARGYGGDYGDDDPYQNRRQPRRTPLPTTSPTTAPPRPTTTTPYAGDPYDRPALPPASPLPTGPTFNARFGGTGDSQGYSYGQTAKGKYSGMTTVGGFNDLIAGRTNMVLDDLYGEAGGYIDEYNRRKLDIGNRTSASRKEAYNAARAGMPTFGSLPQPLYEKALENAGPLAPGVLADTPIGSQPGRFGTDTIAFFGGPTLPGVTSADARSGPGTVSFRPRSPEQAGTPSGYEPVFTAPPNIPANTLQAYGQVPSRPMGSTGMDVALGGQWGPRMSPEDLAAFGITDTSGFAGSQPQFPGNEWEYMRAKNQGQLPGEVPYSSTGPESPQYANVAYNPAADWEAAQQRTGATNQFQDLGNWSNKEMGELNAAYKPTFADIAQFNPDLLGGSAPGTATQIVGYDEEGKPIVMSLPTNQGGQVGQLGGVWTAGDVNASPPGIPQNEWMQNVAINAYGVQPEIAAGMFGPDWQSDYEIGQLRDDQTMFDLQRNADARAQYGVNYSEIPQPETAQEERNRRLAEQELIFADANGGIFPADARREQTAYDTAQEDAIYSQLDQELGQSSREILQSADLTLDQGISLLTPGPDGMSDLDHALEDLKATFDEEGFQDEEAAAKVLRDINQQGGPETVALVRAMVPDWIPQDFLTGF